MFPMLNRGVGRMQIFQTEKDYEAFHRVVEQTLRVAPIRICAYCWMPNPWHFILWPPCDGDLSRFMQRMTNMHTQRWQRAKLRVSMGTCIQGGSSRFRWKATSISMPWCGTWSEMRCGPDSSSVRRTGDGEVCITARGKPTDRCSAIGRCRNRAIGRSTSTRRRRKPNLRPSADASVAEAPTAIPPGSSTLRSNSGCNRPSVVAAGLTKNVDDRSYLAHLAQYMRLSPLFPPPLLTTAPVLRCSAVPRNALASLDFQRRACEKAR